jgi:hypothetical protein
MTGKKPFPFGSPPFDMEHVDFLSRVRYGTPSDYEGRFWDYMIRQRRTAHWARQRFGVGGGIPRCGSYALSAFREQEDGPVWCFTRHGRTITQLEFGDVLHVGGEHEDGYDPNFCIYNDVVVEDVNGTIAIYGYPKDVFPPTDFHTATLVGSQLWLIGSLGYIDLRREGETQVMRLDTYTRHMVPIATEGDNPGWISRHSANYDAKENTIIVRGGKVWDKGIYRDNRHTWVLSLEALMWWRKHEER